MTYVQIILEYEILCRVIMLIYMTCTCLLSSRLNFHKLRSPMEYYTCISMQIYYSVYSFIKI